MRYILCLTMYEHMPSFNDVFVDLLLRVLHLTYSLLDLDSRIDAGLDPLQAGLLL